MQRKGKNRHVNKDTRATERRNKKHLRSATAPCVAKQDCEPALQYGYMCTEKAEKQKNQALPRHHLSLNQIVGRHFNKDTRAATS